MIEGKISKQSLSILIDPWSNHSYITPKIVKDYSLEKSRHIESWLVQVATWDKRKVSELVVKYPIVLNGISTKTNLNVLALGSYIVLIGMDWLEKHINKLDC